jgi:hypothetical protein
MVAPSPSELLSVWEQGQGHPPVVRGLLLLRVAAPEIDAETALRMPLGERDRRLLHLRRGLFGDQVDGLTDCPDCGSPLEFSLRTTELSQLPEAPAVTRWRGAGYNARLRPLTSEDLLAVRHLDPSGARHALLARCVFLTRARREVGIDEVPESARVRLERRLAELDPQGAIRLSLKCPECATAWEAPLDLVGMLWTELEAWASRMLRDVHTLARAYGWSERDILGMSRSRRQAYLQMVAG